MAAIAGHNGSLGLASGYDVMLKEWRLEYTADALDSTSFDDGQDRTFIPGLRQWSVSARANLDSATSITAPGGAAEAVTLTADTGKTFTGNVIITGMSPAVTVEGIEEVEITLQGTGALTITW